MRGPDIMRTGHDTNGDTLILDKKHVLELMKTFDIMKETLIESMDNVEKSLSIIEERNAIIKKLTEINDIIVEDLTYLCSII